MAGVNKQSLRKAFDTAKAPFEHLCPDAKIVVSGRALCPSMWRLFEVLMPVVMERRTQPANPPPNTPKDDTAVTRTGAKGKSPHNAHCGNTRTIDSAFEKVMSHLDTKVQPCPRCQVQTKRRCLADRPGAC